MRTTNLVAFVAVLLPMGALLGTSALADVQIADITDTLDNAVKGPRLINGSTDPYFDISTHGSTTRRDQVARRDVHSQVVSLTRQYLRPFAP